MFIQPSFFKKNTKKIVKTACTDHWNKIENNKFYRQIYCVFFSRVRVGRRGDLRAFSRPGHSSGVKLASRDSNENIDLQVLLSLTSISMTHSHSKNKRIPQTLKSLSLGTLLNE